MFLINISSVAIIWFGSKQVAGAIFNLVDVRLSAVRHSNSIFFTDGRVTFIMIPRAEASAKTD